MRGLRVSVVTEYTHAADFVQSFTNYETHDAAVCSSLMAQWFYSTGGTQAGPVDSAGLKALAASGQLQPTDLVWRDGMADWVAASSVSGLFTQQPAPVAAAAPVPAAPVAHAPSAVLPYVGGGSMSGDPGVTPQVIELLSATRPWVLLVSILMFIGTGFIVLAAVILLFVGLAGAASSSRGGAAMGLGGAFVSVILFAVALLSFFPAMYLAKYASRIASLRAGGRVVDLEGALAAQKSYWKFIGILALIYICFYLLLFIMGGLGRLM
jgi:hypothetical protein